MGLVEGWRRACAILLFAGIAQCDVLGAVYFNDNPPTLSEAGGPIELRVLRADATVAESYNYKIVFNTAEASADFEITSGLVDFAADSADGTITLRPKRDGRVEGSEVFDVVWTSTASGAAVGNSPVVVVDEQTAVGRDYAFPAIRDPSVIFELPDGSVLVRAPVGAGLGFETRRLLPSGEYLAGWNAGGFNMGRITAAHIYPDGSIVLGCFYRKDGVDVQFLRLRADGTPDLEWRLPFSKIYGFQPGGEVVGAEQGGVNRYNVDGSILTFHNLDPNGEGMRNVVVLADGYLVGLHESYRQIPRMAIYTPTGVPVTLPQPILCTGIITSLAGGGFAAIVAENEEPDAPTYLGFYDSQGNQKALNRISGVTALSRFGDGVIASAFSIFGGGGVVRYRGREDLMLFITPEGNALSSVMAVYREPVIVRAGGKLLAYGDMGGGSYGLTQYSIVNAPLSEIDFAAAEYVIEEGETATVRVRRRGDTSQAAAAAVRLVASEPAAAIPAMVQFAPLQSEVAVDLPTADNALPEFDGRIELGFGEVTGATVGENRSVVVRVLDNDGRTGSLQSNTNHWQINQAPFSTWGGNDALRARAMAIDRDGRVYVVARKGAEGGMFAYHADGTVDATFGPLSVGGAVALATQSDGKVLVAGEIRSLLGGAANSIGRITATGQYDSTFRGFPGSAHGVYDVVAQPDDKIIIGGLLRDSAGNGLVRLMKDGLYDPEFSLAPHKFEHVTRVALQTDGKILFTFSRNSLNPEFVAARVNANGSLDNSFQPQRGPIPYQFAPHALTALPDGKVLMSNGPELRALNSDGTPDAGFKLGEQPDGEIGEILRMADGKILVAGTFKKIGGFARGGLARLNADGSVDATFDPGVGAAIQHALVLANGNYLVGGEFTSFNLQPAKTFAEVSSSTTPRFVVWKDSTGVRSSFAANPGSRVTIEQSNDLEAWEFLETRTVSGFSTGVTTPTGGTTKFLRAQVE